MFKNTFSGIYTDLLLYTIFITYVLFHFNPTKLNLIILSIIFFSLVLWLISKYQLGSSFSVGPKAKKLITTGIYSKISHPIYLFTFIANVGIIYLLDNYYLFPLILIFGIIQIIRVKKENQILKNKFKKEYDNYKKKVWF